MSHETNIYTIERKKNKKKKFRSQCCQSYAIVDFMLIA